MASVERGTEPERDADTPPARAVQPPCVARDTCMAMTLLPRSPLPLRLLGLPPRHRLSRQVVLRFRGARAAARGSLARQGSQRGCAPDLPLLSEALRSLGGAHTQVLCHNSYGLAAHAPCAPGARGEHAPGGLNAACERLPLLPGAVFNSQRGVTALRRRPTAPRRPLDA